ncbi:TM2 domain-containing protein [Cohnella pontilimi]|uniref:TM2 domain-containing protein n=2 Tax=Cohnella pontilimi TaxID=2564100 RepID=A0A4U0F7C7_9BACL|nr:TM2 domain-containing protein [Cohnella pontilimi]TJY39894.1 TM2 domain-containing protein [Cohnella pontilimi]
MDARQLMLLESEVKSQGKNMFLAYVLWYFLGLLGGHRFYMQKKGSAVAMLILSITVIGLIVTGIWIIVDAFLLHTWVKDHNRQLEYKLVHEILGHQAPPAPSSF